VILGYLQLLEGRLPPDSREAKWGAQMREAGARIRDAVGRLNSVIRVEATRPSGDAPAMLDSVKSSRPTPDPAAPPTVPPGR
jgi:hypothetical protein